MPILRNYASFRRHTFDGGASSVGVRVFAVGGGGNTQYDPHARRRFWRSSVFAVVYLAQGQGFYRDRHQELMVTSGDVLVLRPQREHVYGPSPQGGWHEYFMLFDGPLIRYLMGLGALASAPPVCRGVDVTALNRCFKEALELADSARAADICPLVINALHILSRAIEHEPGSGPPPQIAAIASHIEHAPADEHDLPRLASQHGISYAKLRKDFPRYYGVPPHQFVLKQRMRMACGLLSEGYSVKQTAFRLGVSSQFHFSRSFKKHVGMSPREYASMARFGVRQSE